MFVKSIMIEKYGCHTAAADDSLEQVLQKFDQHGIDGMPVLEGDRYIGIVTKNRIYERFFNNGGDKDTYTRTTKARDVLTHQDDVLHGGEIFEKLLLKLKDFPLLAVVDGKGDFLGVVTRFDVLEQFQSAFGMQKKGIRIAFTSVETEGRLAKLSEIAHQYHEHIISFVTFDETDELVRRMVMKIEPASNLDKFTKKMEAAGFRILSITED